MHGIIYFIVNLSNSKCYIGSTINPHESWSANHLIELRAGSHPNRHLQNAWSKYGEKSFVYLPFMKCPVGSLRLIEWFYIQQMKPAYNMVMHMRGLTPMTEERKRRIRSTISVSCKKVWDERTDEQRDAIRQNQSEAHKIRWANMDPVIRNSIGRKNSERMKAVWAERKRMKSKDAS